MNLSELKKSIPYKWKVQSQNDYGNPSVTCVAYIDARDVQDLLDSVVGPQNWQNKYSYIDGDLYCSIGIKVDGEWVWKEDVGTESFAEKEKGQASDAFKRAAVHWGVGRFLYSLGTEKLPSEAKQDTRGKSRHTPMTKDKSRKLYGNHQLTEYINTLRGHQTAVKAPENNYEGNEPNNNKSLNRGPNREHIPMPGNFLDNVKNNSQIDFDEKGRIDEFINRLSNTSEPKPFIVGSKEFLNGLSKPGRQHLAHLTGKEITSIIKEVLHS